MSPIARCYILRIRDDPAPREELWLVGPFPDEETAGDFGEAHVNDVWQVVYLSDAAVARPLTVVAPEDGMGGAPGAGAGRDAHPAPARPRRKRPLMRIVGCDPGLSGAIAILDQDAIVLLADLPVHRVSVAGRKGLRAELDLHGLHGLLVEHGPFTHAYVEKVGPMPKQGVTSMFRFGTAFGAIQGILSAMAIPFSLVTPQSWQRWHGCGPSGDTARQRATRLYPQATPLLLRKSDANKADALLIGAFGLHRLLYRRLHEPFTVILDQCY